MKHNIRIVAILVILFATACKKSDQEIGQVEVTISNDSLMNLIQYKTFQYFYKGAEPSSGMARERIHMDGIYPLNDKNVVTSGGSGFGVMALIVGIERGFITRQEGVRHLEKIVNFLERADRFHGVWSHWIEGETGKVRPFGRDDDGGDLVETAFMAQGLLTARQYLRDGTGQEKELAGRIDQLWKEIEWSWHLKKEENVLLWHWSPTIGFKKNHMIKGYDETLITYILAASSPTFAIDPSAYHEGWARSGEIASETKAYDYTLELKHNGGRDFGGPMFWAHYSYLGLDPRGLKDRYADYWEHNVNHTLINRAWCIDNPLQYKGYGPDSWGLTASYSVNGYTAHAPGENRDKGVISPTAALSSFPYTPAHSMRAMRHWYEKFGDKLLGPYGFYDAFSETDDWFPQRYLAIDQGPIVVMMENHRTGLLWDLFMSSPELKTGLQKFGFSSPHFED